MEYQEKIQQALDAVEQVIIGKNTCVEKVMEAILAGGHVLIEDIPGVGKTSLAVAFAKVLDLKQNRVQFTPDVLPADITGFSMYRKETGTFEYQQGAAMCNMFLADEINRTSPKTQSALLEVMEERTVTVDGKTRKVPSPFHVIATENPIGSAGTQMLPESQLDRFMIRLKMGYPKKKDEMQILMSRDKVNPMDHLQPVLTGREVLEIQEEVEEIYLHPVIYEYIVDLITATREHEMLELGVSTRGGLALAKMAKASAFLAGRNYVIPNDVEERFVYVTEHRVRLSSKAHLNHMTEEEVVNEILRSVKKPTPQKR